MSVPSASSSPEDNLAAPPSLTMPPRKTPARLQERRGSNVALLLDVSGLGAEPVCSVSTPKEVWLQLLHTSSRPLTHSLLQNASTDTVTLNTEYQKIPPNFVSAAELDIPGHAIKDRYKTILPNPESRVRLRGTEEEAEPERYINANYIRGYGGVPKAYIATQGPMLHTVSDFWEMVWQERCDVIIMLTALKESNEKCEVYWPEESEGKEREEEEEEEETRAGARTGRYGRFLLRVRETREKDGFIITDMDIQLSSECRWVRHYWLSTWPDHNIPQCSSPLLKLVEEVDTYRKSLLPPTSQPISAPIQSPGPIIVHCSAGIGRTGCYIACSIGSEQLRETGQVDILELVCQLRLDRGGMIQTTEQYQFLYTTMARYSSQLQVSQNQAPVQNHQQEPNMTHELNQESNKNQGPSQNQDQASNQCQEPNRTRGSNQTQEQTQNQEQNQESNRSQEQIQSLGCLPQLGSQLQSLLLHNAGKQ